MRHRTIIGFGLAAVMALGAAPGLGQEDPSPSPRATQIPITTESGRPDLYLDMPYYLGAFEPEIVMTRGQEHFAGLAPDDPRRQQLEGLLETVEAEIEDMVSGYALVSLEDFFSFVVALRIDGVEPGTLLPAYLPLLQGDLEDASVEERVIKGRDVLVIESVGAEDEYVELYVYDEGDTIWMLQGPVGVIETALLDLPDPLEAE